MQPPKPPKPPPDLRKEQGGPGTPAPLDTPENATPTAQGRGLAAPEIATPAEAGGNKVGTMAPIPTTQNSPSDTMTYASACGSNVGNFSTVRNSSTEKLRDYAQIHADAVAASNSSSSSISLQFKLAKVEYKALDGTITKPKSITNDQFGDFLWDVLQIDNNSCLSLDITGRWDTKDLVLKAGTKVEHLLTGSNPRVYLNHEISISQTVKNVTRVYFRNVPPSVPNEEIIHLCLPYSTPIDCIVHKETMRLGTNNRVNITGTTRYVEVKLLPGKFFKNFYWLEGPLPEDQGRRITVLHGPSQPQQCSHCFRYASAHTTSGPPCPGGGNGKICESTETPRTKLSEYTASLKLQDRYVSMKTLFRENKEKSFPGLQKTAEAQMDKLDSMEEVERQVTVQTPLEQRETEVVILKGKLKAAEEKRITHVDSLKKQNQEQIKQLNYARLNHEVRIGELFSKKDTDWESSEAKHLLNSFSACCPSGEFEMDQESLMLKAKNDIFKSGLDKTCIIESKEQSLALDKIKEKVLERITALSTQRERTSSQGSLQGSKRKESISSSLKRANSMGQRSNDNSKIKLSSPEQTLTDNTQMEPKTLTQS